MHENRSRGGRLRASRNARTWLVTRADLASGGGQLLRLAHPLLPTFTSALPGAEGLVLGPAVPAPAPLDPGLDLAARSAYLVRFVALCAFLRHHGLGLAARDLLACGARPGAPARPALAFPPVPAWRAVSPALAGAVLSARLGGAVIRGEDAREIESSVDGALEGGRVRSTAEEVRAARRAAEGGLSAEALVAELARRVPLPPGLGGDLLGLAYPVAFRQESTGGEPASACGEEALFVARGAARRGSEPAFLEVAAGSPLEEGSALLHMAEALRGDPRADAVRALAEGRDPGRLASGPPAALVAADVHLWDPRSRKAFEAGLLALGFRRLETRPRIARLWEGREVLEPLLGVGEVSGMLWLPFMSISHAVAAWEAVASAAGGDPARFVAAARRLALEFEAGERRPRVPALSRLAAPGARPLQEPVLAAAALLPDTFTAEEAAVAAGVAELEARTSLRSACAIGTVAESPDGLFRFLDPASKGQAAVRLPRAARADVVRRLEESGISEERLATGLLARGLAGDLERVQGVLQAADARGDRPRVLEVLSWAEALGRDLGAPLVALRAFFEAGRMQEARAAAGRVESEHLETVSPAERFAVARRLSRLGEGERALALLGAVSTPAGLVARAEVLLALRREEEANRLLASVETARLEAGDRLRSVLLAAEIADRQHDYERASALLADVGDLLPEAGDEDLRAEAAFTAGYLAGDMGRRDEAIAFFRAAHAAARNDGQRADALFDLSAAALEADRVTEAERDLEAALALYAKLGDDARYAAALGNRIDILMKAGDHAAARPLLERVLAHDGRPGREHQYLCAVPARQELALLDGDDEQAAEAFREAEAKRRALVHPAWRQILVLEAARLLMAGRACEARARLEEAGRIPDNHLNSEPLRLRLAASSAVDLEEEDAGSIDLGRGERLLLAAEKAMKRGGAPAAGAVEELRHRARTGRGATGVVWRVLEWAGRFPEAFASGQAEGAVRAGLRAASRAGLSRAALRLELLERRLERDTPPPRPDTLRPESAPACVAEDVSTKAVFSLVARIAPTALPLLVLGETGTGKEVVARELHRLSGRKGPFVAVNMAALSPTLVESELFGHAKGSFTGADRERAGLVEFASGGTLFLDEIGDLPLGLQGKLLRVLQESEVLRLGETRPRRVDLRVVAATHRDLGEMVRAGTFRQDLYYRLRGAETVLAPLRERPRDLARLVERIPDGATLTAPAFALLESYPWPGNVRELLSALEAALALAAPARRIEPEHLPPALRASAVMTSAPRAGTYRQAVDGTKKDVIAETVRRCGGNRTRAAKALGLSRQSLLYAIKRLKIEV